MTVRDRPNLDDLFRKLDRWRHLPAYRLEPNLAPFFGLYLRHILNECLETKPVTHPIIIPEFPLRLGTLYENSEDLKKARRHVGENQSVQVDYAAFSSDLKKVYFIELKTDEGSINKEQKKYLIDAKKKGFGNLLSGIRQICTQKQLPSRQKYVHLIDNLMEIGLIEASEDARNELFEKTFPKVVKGWGESFNRAVPEICVRDIEDRDIEIIYITPSGIALGSKNTDFFEIGFRNVITVVEGRGDLGHLFACYLGEWIEPAGIRNPQRT